MKKIFTILVIFLICAVGKTATASNNTIVPDPNNTAVSDTNTTADCQEKIKQLEQTVKAQRQKVNRLTAALEDVRKQLDEQVKENERLKALLPKDKINSVVPAAGFDPNNGIVYNGKKRDIRWFNYMYKEFQNKIAYINNKYYDIQEGLLNQKIISKDSVVMGTVVTTPPNCKVYRVLGNGEMLIIRPGSENSTTVYQPGNYIDRPASSKTYTNSIPELVYHVKGITDNIIDGQQFSNVTLISCGTYKYTSTDGANRTIQSLVVYEPLTRERFADALNSGFILTKQIKVGDKTVEQSIP